MIMTASIKMFKYLNSIRFKNIYFTQTDIYFMNELNSAMNING